MKKLNLSSYNIKHAEVLTRTELGSVALSGSGAFSTCLLNCGPCPNPYQHISYFASITNCEGTCTTDSANKQVSCNSPAVTVKCSPLLIYQQCLPNGSGSGSKGSGSRGSIGSGSHHSG